MNVSKTFDVVNAEYGQNIATLVVFILSIHMSIKIIKCTQKKIEKKSRRLLWEHSSSDVDLAIRIESCLYDYEIGVSLGGIGGCITRSLKDIVDSKGNN